MTIIYSSTAVNFIDLKQINTSSQIPRVMTGKNQRNLKCLFDARLNGTSQLITGETSWRKLLGYFQYILV